jgi:GH18 family chitinase
VIRLLSILAALFLNAVPAQAHERPVAIGYVAAFKGLDRIVERGGFEHYTHLNLSFANPDSSGAMERGGGLACAPAGDGSMVSGRSLRKLVEAGHQAGAKVLVSVGGGVIPPCSGDWAKLLEPANRAKIVAGLIRLVDTYRLDGVDVDLEGELMTRIDRAGNYTPFVAELSAALRARSKLLTAATATYEGGMVPDSALPYFDLIGIMSYDAIGPTWGTAGDEHAPFHQAKAHLDFWIAKGIPRAKLALGLPFYGYGFGGFRRNYRLSDIAAEYGMGALGFDVIGRRCGGCPYITYNGLATLEKKARMAGIAGVGVMVWETDHDLPRHEAIRAVLAAHREGLAIGQY